MSVSGSDAAFQAMEGGFNPDAVLIDLAVKDTCVAEFLRCVKATYAVPVIAVSPGPILERIGPTADRELHEFFDVRDLLAVLDELCTSPRSPAG
jgi:chemotaxis response regulator CheB